MIADPHDGPRTCSRCEHSGRCPTPQACEQAEEERARRRGWRDFTLAIALIAVVLGTLALINWRTP